jgi:two-component system, NarL family, nitrate/nitrite response regulator NarL
MVEVLIVSDVRLYRDGLAETVARDELIDVVGTAADAREAVQAAGALSPAVVIVNVAMRDGIPLARTIRFAKPNVRVVALAVPDDEHDVIAWAEAGATGLVTTDQSLGDLLEAIKRGAR